jgi:hypothetical protein
MDDGSLLDSYQENLTKAIEDTKKTFENRVASFTPFHKLLRRLGSISSFVFLIGLFTSVSNLKTLFGVALTSIKINIINLNIPYAEDKVYISISFFFLTLLILANSIGLLKHSIVTSSLIFVYGLAHLFIILLFDSQVLSIYLLTFGALTFVMSYSTNRKYGYTRGWSRNRVYITQLDILLCENNLQLDTPENIRQKLNNIILQAKIEAHKDIVNDYIKYGNSAMGWLSKTKN